MRSVDLWLGLGLLALLPACSPKYFTLDNLAEEVRLRDPDGRFDPGQANEYVMTLKPRVFYKNNIEETILLPDNSAFLTSGNLLLLDSTDTRNPRWHTFHGWMDPAGNGHQRVALASAKGRTDGNGTTTYERVTIFYGWVDKDIFPQMQQMKSRPEAVDEPEHLNVRFDREVTLIGKGSKVRTAKGSGRDPRLVAVVQPDKAHMVIYALVDRSQTNIGVEKSIIFDFSQIYGEPLWLDRRE